MGLALLKIKGGGSFTPLSLGTADKLVETMEMTAFGYPFGKMIKAKGQDYPSISVNIGRITSLRKSKGKLERIQLDAMVNPGNSGGPVLDKDGRVVGVVVSGVYGSGVNFAIPADKVTEFLATPTITFHPPRIAYDQRYDPATFKATAVSFTKDISPVELKLTLLTGKDDRRQYTLKRGKGGTYTVEAPPLIRPKDPSLLPVKIKFIHSTVECFAKDTAFKIGKQSVRLSEIETLNVGRTAEVITRDREELSGAISGLGKVAVKLGGRDVKLDLSRAINITVEIDEEPTYLEYALTARSGGKNLDEAKGTIYIEQPEEYNGGWIDVLKMVEPAKHSVHGKWVIKDGALVGTSPAHAGGTSPARIVLPAIPDGSYELEVVIAKTKGKIVELYFPAGKGYASLHLDATYPKLHQGIGTIKGRPSQDNETTIKGGKLADDKDHLVRLRVILKDGKAEIDVWLNGKSLISWKGNQSDLSRDSYQKLPNNKALGLAMWRSQFTFKRARLRMLSGQAFRLDDPDKPLRPASIWELVPQGKHKLAMGYRIETYVTGLKDPQSLAFSPGGPFGCAGQLFVGDARPDPGTIYRVPRKGEKIVFARAADNQPRSFEFAPVGSDFGPYLYATHAYNIVRYDSKGKRSSFARINAFGRDLAFAPAERFRNHLFHADGWEPSGEAVREWTPSGAGGVLAGKLKEETAGLAFDPGGRFGRDLYVARCESSRAKSKGAILRITPDGKVSEFVVSDKFGCTIQVAFDVHGRFRRNLFVSDCKHDTIFEVTPAGRVEVFARGFAFSRAPQDRADGGDLVFGPDGALYVADAGAGTIWRIWRAALPGRLAAGWTNVLKKIDPAKHAVGGKWEMKDGALVGEGRLGTRVTVPAAPRGEYEWQVTFRRTSGHDVQFILPVGKTSVAVVLSNWFGELHGLHRVKGKEPRDNETGVKPGKLQNDRDYTVNMKVTLKGDRAEIRVDLDGKRLIAWEGPQSDLSMDPKLKLPDTTLGLGIVGKAQFKSCRLRTLSGGAVSQPE